MRLGKIGRRFRGQCLAQRCAESRERHDGIVGKTEKRRPQNADQGDCVIGIIQEHTEIDEIVDFLLGEERAAADEVIVDAAAAKDVFVNRHVGQGAKQNREIAGLHAPQPDRAVGRVLFRVICGVGSSRSSP